MRTLITSLAAALLASSAGAVTVINGSFENGVALSGQTTVATGDNTSITGWTTLANGVDYTDSSVWAASDGNRSVDLSSYNVGGLMQRVDGFTTGLRYRISFDVSVNPNASISDKRLIVSATGGSAVLYLYAFTAANSATNMLYQTLTYDFVASGKMQNIQFRSLEQKPNGIVLDNVSIGIIPEPATWALLISGFAMVGVAARRRRAVVAA